MKRNNLQYAKENPMNISTRRHANLRKGFHGSLSLLKALSFILFVSFSQSVKSSDSDGVTDSELIDQFVISNNLKKTIVFDSGNIKRFWVSNAVSSSDNLINILLDQNGKEKNKMESVPLEFKLINVDESMDCRIDILSDSPDIAFSIANMDDKPIPSPNSSATFKDLYITSSTIHMDSVKNHVLRIIFNSYTTEAISIKNVILSFSENNSSQYLRGPGEIKMSKESVALLDSTEFKQTDDGFVISGKKGGFNSKYNLLASGNKISTHVKIKNIGDVPAKVYVGFLTYSKERRKVNARNYPYSSSNEIIRVVSCSEGSKSIVVDKYPQWRANCCLAVNAEEDLSDLPNTTFVDGKIVEIKRLDNNQAEIVMDTPLKQKIQKGDKLRVNGASTSNIYLNVKTLNPGEEEVFESSISRNDHSAEYSTKAFPKGIYYVKPLVYSYSVDPEKENTVSVKDYSVSY